MGDGPVLLHLLAQGHLGAEGLVGRLPNTLPCHANLHHQPASQPASFISSFA